MIFGCVSGGGGSGGGVYVAVKTLSGSGTISANGMRAGTAYPGFSDGCRGGGGGGGRVAVYYGQLSGFNPASQVTVTGGDGGDIRDGGVGTIYLSNGVAPVTFGWFDPQGLTNGVIDRITFHAGNPLAAGSLGLGDLTLTRWGGGTLSLASVAQTGVLSYRVMLANPVSEEGIYRLVIGTDVVNTFGGGPLGPTTNEFVIDWTPPVAPMATNYAAAPATNWIQATSAVLRGTREDESSVWQDETQRVARGSGTWTGTVSLAQGLNAVMLHGRDAAGNRSVTNTWNFLADTVAPVVTAVNPANGVSTAAAPAAVVVTYAEAVSGLDAARSQRAVTKGGVAVPGEWTATTNLLTFTPAGTLADGTYVVAVRLCDALSNTGTAFSSTFAVDTAAPAAPVVNPATSPTTINQQTIAGTREANTAILRDGTQVVVSGASTNWSYVQTLTNGWNNFALTARDAAGNASAATNVQIRYNNMAPGAVAVTGQVAGVGTQITLGWSGYDELAAGGDIAGYQIYQADASFANAGQATQIGVQEAGRKSFVVTGLARNVAKHYAVIARDSTGLCNSNVSSVALAPVDVVAPPDPTGMVFTCGATNLVLEWSASADPHADLAGYRVYVTNAAVGVEYAATNRVHGQPGLVPSSSYVFRVTSFDATGNESAGLSATGYTVMPNPVGLRVTPYDGYVEMSWAPVQPSAYVKHYAIYASTSAFASVSGMTARATTAATNAGLAGFQNGVANWFAVTTVNPSGGENPAVTSVAATTLDDVTGPALANLKFNGYALSAPATKPGSFTVTGGDPAGMSRVEVRVKGALLETVVAGTTNFSAFWNVANTTNDGAHAVEVTAYDTRGNRTVLATNITVALAKPVAPVLTQPSGVTAVSRAWQTVSGTGAVYATAVVLSRNGQGATDATVNVASDGRFDGSLTLAEGTNAIRAAAVNRAGTGTWSQAATFVMDTSLPAAPLALTATAQADGNIRLTWADPVGTSTKGYQIYRANSPFSQISQAWRVNASLLADRAYTDLPNMDGTYYYRVSAVNQAGSEGPLSEEASATADRVPPRVLAIEYQVQGIADLDAKRFGRGTVTADLTMSEPLQSGMFFSFNPTNGAPISVALTAVTETHYRGSFVVSAEAPCGMAYATFSGRDRVGNRGTDIEQGGTITLDVCGPVLRELIVTPSDPIGNSATAPATVMVSAAFDADDVPVATPALRWSLSSTRTGETAVSLFPLTTRSWAGSFTLPTGAGLPPESLSVRYEGVDSFGNTGRTICAASRFQVYQGSLPPYAAPDGMQGKGLPDGWVSLWWKEVPGASDYAVYRGDATNALACQGRSQGATEYRLNAGNRTSWYAVASVRVANGLTSTGAACGAIAVVSDALPPSAPTAPSLALQGSGLRLEWTGPSETGMHYEVFRNAQTFADVGALQPIATNLPNGLWLDPNALPGPSFYRVVSVDAVGNRSAPSESAYTNLSLLPVRRLSVYRERGGLPRLDWDHGQTSGIDGFNVYEGEAEQPRLLKAGLSPATTSYVDTAYTRGSRAYWIAATDGQTGTEQESVRRSILLPDVEVTVPTNALIKRGVMNRLTLATSNAGGHAVSGARLYLDVLGHSHASEPFDLPIGAFSNVQIVVGGYANLPAVAAATLRMELEPNPNEKIVLASSGTLDVGTGMLTSEVLNDEFVRGTDGKVRFAVQNTSEEEIQIVLASASAQSVSPEVRIKLLDADGMVFGTTSPQQAIGDEVETLANGTTVARIPAGARFVSADMALAVPTNAPNELRLQLEVDKVHYQLGEPEHVEISGMQSTRSIELVDTRYTASVTNVNPTFALGSTNIVLQGHAVNRATGLPEKNVAVKLVIAVDGYERTYTVYADSNGQWRHVFVPLAGESGQYAAWAVHPSVVAKPRQVEFVVSQVGLWPVPANVNIVRNYAQTIPARVTPSRGMNLTNVTLSCAAADQTNGAMPSGVSVCLPEAVALIAGGTTATLPFSIAANDEAPTSCQVRVRVNGDGAPPGGWGVIPVNLNLLDASPVLNWSPNYVYTGVAISNMALETVTLQNTGHAALEGVTLSLVQADGSSAPGWARLLTATNVGALAKGESKAVDLMFAPTATVSELRHEFRLRVAASNHPTRDVNVFVGVDGSMLGQALFKVSDIYAGTPDARGEINQGLAGATITLQKESGSMLVTNRVTDALGEALFDGLPVGAYTVKVAAQKHDTYGGRILIRTGMTETKEVFLPNNLVTVEWSVKPIAIEDRYEVALVTTYVTDVPAAVVVIEPASVQVPEDMQAGDVFQGELKISNYGLIRADNVVFTPPDGGDSYRLELLCEVPASLQAKQVVRIPYKIVKLKNTAMDAADGGGWKPCKLQACGRLVYTCCCANGTVFAREAFLCLFEIIKCLVWDMWGGGGGAGGFGGGGGGGDGSSGGPAALPQSSSGCSAGLGGGGPPDGAVPSGGGGGDDPCPTGDCTPPPPDPCDPKVSAHSVVSASRGDYEDEVVDLRVKVAGDSIEVARKYDQYRWNFGYLGEAKKASISIPATNEASRTPGEAYCYVILNDRDYAGSVQLNGDVHSITQGVLHAYNGERLERRGSFWELFEEDRWSRYGEDGRLLEYGEEHGAKIRLVYDDDDRVIGVQDHFTNQVLWVEYAEVNGTSLVAQVRDVRDRKVSYAYDDAGNLIRVSDVAGYETRYAYDDRDRLISKDLPGGERVEIEYNDAGTVSRVGDKRYQHRYDSESGEYYVSVLHPDGRLEEFWYDSTGSLVRSLLNGLVVSEQVDGDGAQADAWPQYTYDDNGRLTQIAYENGQTATCEYQGPAGQLSKHVNRRGLETDLEHDEQGGLVRMRSAVGTEFEEEVRYEYDDLGNLVRETRVGKNEVPDVVWRWTYDAAGNVQTETDPWGQVTSNRYDNLGNVLASVDPGGNVRHYDYDVRGLLTGVCDSMGVLQSNRYDAAQRKIWSQDEMGRQSTWTYSVAGRLLAVTNGLGEVARWDYDVAGRVVRERGFDGQETTYAYDAQGNATLLESDGVVDRAAKGREIRTSLPREEEYRYDYDEASGLITNMVEPGEVGHFQYDAQGNLVRLVFEKNGQVRTNRWEYDEFGQKIWHENAEGGQTRYSYDLLGRLTQFIDVLGRTNTFHYNERGEIGQVTDGQDRRTRVEHDFSNKLARTVLSDSSTRAAQSDWANRLAENVDAMGHTQRNRYDARGNLVETSFYQTPEAAAPELTHEYAYDALGRVIRSETATVATDVDYQDSNRTQRVTVDYGPFSKSFEYGFDSKGRKVSFTDPAGTVQQYAYDADGALQSVTLPGHGVVSYSHDETARWRATTYPGGTRQEVWLDSNQNQASNRVVDPAGQIVMSQTMRRDPMDRIVEIDEGAGKWQYDYDLLGQLISARYPAEGEERYGYDGNGNRLSSSSAPGAWECDGMNRLIRWPNGSYVYDAAGQVTQRVVNGSTRNFEYDVAGKMIAVRDADGQLVARYGYDPQGRRISKEVGGVATWYLYSDEGLIGEYDAEGHAIREYGYLPGGTWMMDPLFMMQSNACHYFLNDHRGAPLGLMSEQGALAWSIAQQAFGKATVEPSSRLTTPLRFSGQLYDEETGLHYNTFRYYDPETGRYLTPDPLGFATGMNQYHFCANDPVNRIDSFGLSSDPTADGCLGSGGDECKKLKHDREMLSLAAAAYTNIPPTNKPPYDNGPYPNGIYSNSPNGWVRAQTVDRPEIGFSASLFYNPATGQYVAAFRGSDGEVNLKNPDWAFDGNFGQGAQYEAAVNLMKEWSKTYPGIEATGHSLAGGMAALGGGLVGVHSTTFNSAGVFETTARHYGTSREELSKYSEAYIIEGEMLDVVQGPVRTGVNIALPLGYPIGVVSKIPEVKLPFKNVPILGMIPGALELTLNLPGDAARLYPSPFNPLESVSALGDKITKLPQPAGYEGWRNLVERHMLKPLMAAMNEKMKKMGCE